MHGDSRVVNFYFVWSVNWEDEKPINFETEKKTLKKKIETLLHLCQGHESFFARTVNSLSTCPVSKIIVIRQFSMCFDIAVIVKCN